jgi:hypothetical protein
MADIGSARSGNWSNTSTWIGGVVPTEGDLATIYINHTVTVDQNIIIGKDAGTAITINGILNVPYNIASDYTFTLKGTVSFGSGGEFKIGDSTNRLDNARTFTIYINYSASLAAKKYSFTVGATGKVSWYGADKLSDTTLANDMVANNSNKVFTTSATPTGWRSGDIIVLADERNRTLVHEGVIDTISGYDITLTGVIGTTVTGVASTASNNLITKNAHGLVSGDSIIFSSTSTPSGTVAGTTYYVGYVGVNTFTLHTSEEDSLIPINPIDITSDGTGAEYYKGTKKAGWFVMNMSHNIVVKNYNDAYQSHFQLSGNGTNQNKLSNIMFNGLGEATQSGVVLQSLVLDSTVDNNIFSMYKCFQAVTTGSALINTIKTINCYHGLSYPLNSYGLSFIGETNIDKANILTTINSNIILTNTTDLRINNLNVIGAGASGIFGITTNGTCAKLYINNLYARASYVAISTGTVGVGACRIENIDSKYMTYAIFCTGNFYIKNFESSNSSSGDILGTAAGFINIANATLGSTIPVSYASGSIKIERLNDIDNSNIFYYQGCYMQQENNIYRTNSPSIKLNINNINKVYFPIFGSNPAFYVNSGKIITLTCYTRRAESTTGTASFQIQKGTSGRGLTETTEHNIFPSTTDTWELKTLNLGTATESGFVYLDTIVTKGSTLWNLYIDDLTITES